MRRVHIVMASISVIGLLTDGKKCDKDGQKEKEERIRIFKEQQEEGRLKKLKDIEKQFLQAKKHREQQEEQRKRRIEEVRNKETERRQLVEERKRQIWEAEQERKEAILRRNMEREARIEARRNAQRMSQSFAFGSSTPRTFDLDLIAIGVGKNTTLGSVLMSSVSGRRSEERELGPPRATSACSLGRKFGDDCMSRSMVSLSSSAFRGRKRTDIMPTLTRERSLTPHITSRGNCMRTVSMTRLDLLAQPRRCHRTSGTGTTTNIGDENLVSSNMSKSMCNLASAPCGLRRAYGAMHKNNADISQSMLHLADKREGRLVSPTFPKSHMRSVQSMVHLAGIPKLTRAARLRAEALAKNRAASAWNLNKPDLMSSGHNLFLGKDTSRSPPRPQSSMSGASEISATSSSVSAVNMGIRSAPRKSRPFSVAGSIVHHSVSSAATSGMNKEMEHLSRVTEKPVFNTVCQQPRAKSVGQEKSEKPMKPMKPIPPPKSVEVLARAKAHPVPIRDNLRKSQKPSMNAVINAKSCSVIQVLPLKHNVQSKIDLINPSLASPMADSNVYISSESSVTESYVIAVELNKNISESGNVLVCPPFEPSDRTEDISSMIDQHVLQQKVAAINKSENVKEMPSRPRITSEGEAKAALAEKRRLAREQVEREAEIERQCQEEMRRREEEKIRLEELEIKELEKEQLRLAELHRQMEEEKLKKAIEEKQQSDKEERNRKEEEARLKAEKEEQERKAREEAEKQRVELEERLKKEEEERAERKKRVEQIMARTRNRTAQNAPHLSNSPKTFVPNEVNSSASNTTVNDANKCMPLQNGSSAVITVTSDSYFPSAQNMSSQSMFPDILVSNNIDNPAKNNSYNFNTDYLSCVKPSTGFVPTSNRTEDANDVISAVQTNGYNSQEDMICTTGPEEHFDVGLLINVDTNLTKETSNSSSPADLVKLVSMEPTPFDLNNDNYLINIDNINFNMTSSDNSFAVFEDHLQKKDASVDLLS